MGEIMRIGEYHYREKLSIIYRALVTILYSVFYWWARDVKGK